MANLNALPDFEEAELAIEPLERASTIPSSWYCSPEVFSFDLKHVLGRSWQYVGPAAWAREPGQCFPAEVAGNPVLVVRGKAGELRAFYNVCRHRGGPIVLEREQCKVLQCKYHGWTFQLDGSLRGIPKFRYVELFNRRDFGLTPLSVETWNGMIFVNLGREAAPLAETVGGVSARIAPLSLENLHFHSRVEYELDCNWKTYVDNFLEGYHLPYVHPELCSVLDFAEYVTETAEHYSLQYSPIQDQASDYGTAGGDAYYYCVFPNFMLNILPGRVQTNSVLATAPEQCRVIFDYYYEEVDSPSAEARIAADIRYSHRVQEEDVEICRHVQRGLRSEGYDQGRFSVECEAAVHHFQALLKQSYSQALACLQKNASK